MRTTVKVLSIIAVILGGLTILSSFGEVNAEEASYAIIGGGMFLGYGICVLVHLGREK